MRSIGYLFTQRVPRPQGIVVAARSLVTLSPCLAQFVPGDWSIEWVRVDDREAAARAAGVPDAAIARTIAWVTERVDPGPIGVIGPLPTLALAYELGGVAELGAETLLLGMALADADVARFVEALAPPPHVGELGERRVARLEHSPAPGECLGWDIVGFDHGRAHSYLCNHLAPPIAAELGFEPDDNALYRDEEVAHAIAAWVERGEVGAEPCPWFAVAVTRYPWPAPSVDLPSP